MSQIGVQSAATDEQTNLSMKQQENQEIIISIASDNSIACPDLIDGDRGDYIRFAVPLYEASMAGDWNAAKQILDRRPELVRYSITDNGETALHVAASAVSTKRVEKFVEHLVKYIEVKYLEMKDNNSNTALCIVAAAGNVNLTKIMVARNKALLTIPGSEGMMPLHMAAMFGHREVAKYLLKKSQWLNDDGWTPENCHSLLLKCVEADLFAIVGDHPELSSSGSVLGVLARKPDAFCYRRTNFIMTTINWAVGANEEEESRWAALFLFRFIWKNIAQKHRNEIDVILRGPPDPPFKQGEKPPGDEQDQSLELLKQISDGIDKMTAEIRNIVKEPPAAMQIYQNVPLLEDADKRYSSQIIFVAAEMGNATFLTELIRLYPDLIWKVNDKNQSIFHTAVEHRQEAIYNLLYEIGSKKDQITLLKDTNGNNMLHLVGKFAKRTQLEEGSGGVALQMQLELLWFTEVWEMVPHSYRFQRNKDGLTPLELFTMEHKDLGIRSEEWMKGTAGQCMVVAALVATMVFTAAFTVPGGYNQNNGIPYFYEKGTFIVFVVSDAMSLFSASASIIMFLSILTSRYAERDFMKSLLKKLMLGLAALFLSIATMMVAFSVSFFILY